MSLDESEQKIDVREGIVHSSIPADELARLSDDVISALKTVYDPEIPADIFELGLVYKIDIEDDRMVKIMMTLTAPGCGMGPMLAQDVQNKALCIEGIDEANVELVWEPQWNQGMMSEAARLQLGLY